MGKKAKLGKFRKDKFYKLAKETGYRSRAAFKLIQLNRKFEFLQESQVCVDLCAAPGGWMQVAKQNMPVSSIVVGVDLYPIKPIDGCISLIGDITTDKCRTMLGQELQTWKADVILHDGAPNVGKNWLFDAYQQICLTLHAVKLSTQFLRKGGWFVTKVFRSKDYNALLWVLKQLFRKVHATKPSASRKESAEIFVVCQCYLAPDKIDPKLLDVKYVFEELDLDRAPPKSLLHPDRKKRVRAEGYTEAEVKLRNELSVTEFMESENGLVALQNVSSIVIDHDGVRNHPRTTGEILECCKDIKVLGRKDLKGLLTWWKHVRADLFVKPNENLAELGVDVAPKELSQEDVENMEFEELEKEITVLAEGEQRDLKRKRKKVKKERIKLNEKLNLKMVIKGDEGPREEFDEIFELKEIKTAAELEAMQDVSPDFIVENNTDQVKLPKYTKYEKDDKNHLDDDGLYENGDESDEAGSSSESEADLGKKGLDLSDEDDDKADKGNDSKIDKKQKKKQKEHPLIKSGDFRDKETKRNQRAQLWFEKERLQKLGEDDEDIDLDHLTDEYKSKGVKILNEIQIAPAVVTPGVATAALPLGKKAQRRARHDTDKKESGSEESSTEDESEDESKENSQAPQKKIRLTEEELAIGSMMIKGRKTKRDLIDMAWNRYTFDDTGLPSWFVQDEELHMRKPVPVPSELAEEYENKVRELNVRPLKKVMEAKARKRRRVVKKMKKAQKQAEQILENADASAQEKTRQLKKLYKKAAGEKKKDITYVVARKHLAGKRMRRPPGVKGRFKVVDPRMKKEKRAAKIKDSRSKKKGKKGKN